MSETVVHNQHGCEIKMLDDSSQTAEQSNKTSPTSEKVKFLRFLLGTGGRGRDLPDI